MITTNKNGVLHITNQDEEPLLTLPISTFYEQLLSTGKAEIGSFALPLGTSLKEGETWYDAVATMQDDTLQIEYKEVTTGIRGVYEKIKLTT